ncbi:SpoVR family protein [Nitratireductor sp. ZSWI3]|uniref:SpoVR family protein n=1 Tax=Nitratireductor sp. ZSWI3 TaxID=2966359 RepID=UPI0021504265|nr:SpoVR family protein [Nitratireductor sp. ZSWI3]MCR4268512.1 SpoVR family protein [Nitratireductor sp. ZSWI3]
MAEHSRRSRSALLFDEADWNFDTLRRTYDAIEEVARKDLGLDVYPNQIEIISSEQMLDAYSSIGMPLMYHHWSFGKHFLTHERLYRKGARGLAYEIVINSDPCISYCLEENTMPLQALVMAHAAFGHNHFFKSNHLFKQWTDAEGILDYLDYARRYIARCEEQHGVDEVETVLDAAHALMPSGVFRHRRPRQPSLREAEEQRQRRRAAAEQNIYYLWNTIPNRPGDERERDAALLERKREMRLPEENLLYFLEHYSPVLESWQREILRIVRNVGQYFYPQKQTKVMNEGCACFVHYHILNTLHAEGRLTDGAMLEILHSHTNVLTQPDFDDPRFQGINPYALGFAMMQDIRRICDEPTDEDREWFPDIAGKGDWRDVLKHAWANYRDESFIQQFLSPAVMRRFRMFALSDVANETQYTVTGIHDARGYRHLRDILARNHDVATLEPDIQVVDADLLGDRCLHMRAMRRDGVPLDATSREATLKHVERLWGYKVELEETDPA